MLNIMEHLKRLCLSWFITLNFSGAQKSKEKENKQ